MSVALLTSHRTRIELPYERVAQYLQYKKCALANLPGITRSLGWEEPTPFFPPNEKRPALLARFAPLVFFHLIECLKKKSRWSTFYELDVERYPNHIERYGSIPYIVNSYRRLDFEPYGNESRGASSLTFAQLQVGPYVGDQKTCLCPTNLMVALDECIESKGGFTLSHELKT